MEDDSGYDLMKVGEEIDEAEVRKCPDLRRFSL